MQYLCTHVHAHVCTIRLRHLCTCRYAAIQVNRPSGISQAAAIAVHRPQGVKQKINSHIHCNSFVKRDQCHNYVTCSTEIRQNWAEVGTEKWPKKVYMKLLIKQYKAMLFLCNACCYGK